MEYHLLRICCVISLIFGTFGCATSSRVTPSNAENDKIFWEEVSLYKKDPSSSSYESLWNTYLNSSQPEDSGTKHNEYLSVLAKLESGEKQCKDINWDRIVKLNYWSIKPHLSAATCKAEMQDNIGAKYHQDFVALILEGVFASGKGTDYFNAYEVASWGDIEDIIELAGMKSIDNILELRAARQGVYYVVIAESIDTGKQQNIYFNNIRFLNAAMGHDGIFGGRAEQLGVSIATTLANDNGHSAIALGDILASEEEYEKAFSAYLKATLFGSPTAYLRLASMCLSNKLSRLNEAVCLEYLSAAAEMEIADAFILLSAIYAEGIWVEKNKNLQQQFFEIAELKLKPGDANKRMGELYAKGILGDNSSHKSKAFFEKAASQGKISRLYVEQLRELTEEESERTEQARLTIKQFAEQGEPFSQAIVGAWYLLESNEKEDLQELKKSFSLVEKSAEQGLPRAQYMLSTMFKYGIGVDKDLNVSQTWLRKAALSWHQSAQYDLAVYYKSLADQLAEIGAFRTNTLSTDAFNWMRAAAIQGHTKAIVQMGVFNRLGIGTQVNFERAALWFQVGVERNDRLALAEYADLLRYGRGVKKDIDQAIDLLSRSSELGNLWATNELGRIYQSGDDVFTNHKKSHDWFVKAAEADYQWAQYNLGVIYENGTGVEVNLELAKSWYQKAAAQGHLQASQRLTALTGS